MHSEEILRNGFPGCTELTTSRQPFSPSLSLYTWVLSSWPCR